MKRFSFHRERLLKKLPDTSMWRGMYNFQGAWPKTPGRLVGVFLVRLYQIFFSGFSRGACRHLPTCSEYAYEAIARHGFFRGAFMSLFRLLRCGPGGTMGFDPVPEALPFLQIFRKRLFALFSGTPKTHRRRVFFHKKSDRDS